MELKLDGNLELRVRVMIQFSYLIWLRQWIRSRAVTGRIFFVPPKRSIFPHSYAT